tara:strand:+ start:60 stop:1475 length:1416 start_codon:yes stop_codon:yes gene_type:complete
MRFNQKAGKTPWLHLASIALVISLTACDNDNSVGNDGNSNSSSNEDETTSREIPTGATTGVLMDAQVSGVSYATSSGKSGVTDDQGTYDYIHGDTVEFKLGGLILGNVKATPIVTPIELADGNDNKLRNLLLLLQSLDADGDRENGISISADTATAVHASINLKSDPAKFVASNKFQAALEAGDLHNTAQTLEEANTHFASQSTVMLGTHIWVRYDDTTADVIRFATSGSGEYLHGQASPDDSCTINRVCAGKTLYRAGVEYGFANAPGFDTRGFKLSGTTTVDTNLRAGLSNPDSKRRIRTDGYKMVSSDIVTVQREREQPSVFGELFHVASPIEFSDKNEVIPTEVKETLFYKMDNVSSSIVGAWAYDKDAINTQTLLFFANNKFMLIDPVGADRGECGEPGVEFASYSYQQDTHKLKMSNFTYNSNQCAGFSDDDSNGPIGFTISADGNTAELEKQGEEPVTLYRVSN